MFQSPSMDELLREEEELLQRKKDILLSQNPNAESSDKSESSVESNIAPAGGEYTYGQRAGQALRGLVSEGAGGLADIVGSGFGARDVYLKKLMKDHPELVENQREPISLREESGKLLNKAFRKDLSPTDTLGHFLTTGGSFGLPMSKAATGLRGIKPLATHLAGAAGASAALNLTPSLTEEGGIPRVVEDIGKATIGSALGSKVPGLVTKPKQALAKAASKFIKPNEEFLKKAEKHSIDVPFNVGAESTPANFIANNYLKTMFTSKQYKDSLRKADLSVIDSMKRSIDNLGELNLKPHEASLEYKNFLKQDEKVFKSAADKLYENARKSLKHGEEVSPINTLKSLQSQPVKELLETVSPSSGQKKVIERIKEIKDNLIPGSQDLPKGFVEKYGENEKFMQAALKGLKNKKTTDVSKLTNLRSSLMQTLQYDPEVRGAEAFLSRIVRDLDKDINSVKNTDFLNKYRQANQFFKNNIANRFREDIAKSVMTGKSPQDAFNLMNSVENIKLFEKITGADPKGREIFNALKKAKAKQMLEGAIQGDLETGHVRGEALSNMFKKGEKRQELLESLLGKQQYNNLSEIAEISGQFAKDGRELLNTSGTAHVLSDIGAAKNLSSEVMRSLSYLLGASTVAGAYTVGGLTGAGAAVAAPYALSKLLSDKEFVTMMRSYAIARKAGKETMANNILKKIVPITENAIKVEIANRSNKSKKESKEESE